ncbi:hypothetical protein CEK62_07500 [Alcanivorax sp. N3-2A]|nr:hypothetical protein CEK62_07500 [Alcanivorax sp. N3-2A]|tara:strand:- start:14708 stop:15010 length:303 start_codon:yes stop_codon:yes gene_type:complete
MEKITARQLNGRHVEKIVLRSVVLSVCIVQVRIDGVLHNVVDEQGAIVRFNGAEHANNVLAKLTTDRAVLVHQSPYGEMAGQPEDSPTAPLEVDFNWRAG